jgi:pimeloyl-ACP methyl ester carboxylesterase
MLLKTYFSFLVAFLLLSACFPINAQTTPDVSIQPNARQLFAIWTNEIGKDDYGNCYSRFPRDLKIYDSTDTAWATFSGGARIGSYWVNLQQGIGTCQGLYGYATVKNWIGGGSTQMSDTITVTFAPKKLRSVHIIGKSLQTYLITINNTISRTYTSPASSIFSPFQSNEANLRSMGFQVTQLSNVAKITIKAVDTNWAFAVSYIGLSELDNENGGGGIPLPPTPRVENPVIFVPGVGASELKEENARIKWLSPDIRDMGSDIDDLKLPSNKNIFATDVFRGLPNQVYINNQFPAKFYQNLITDFFKKDVGLDLKEYKVGGNPLFRTTNGCDLPQKTNDPNTNPKLFVFAYDWRKSNVETAAALRDYIGCVTQFHPGKKVRIVAHSMGGLVTRRYALDYGSDNTVDKIITIGTPFLGAPRSIHSLETGSFLATAYGSSPVECAIDPHPVDCLAAWAVNRRYASSLKSAMETFPGPLQLLPSYAYFNLHTSDRSDTPFSITQGFSREANYDYQNTKQWLNENHFTQPGNQAENFHLPIQDDWRQDTSNIKFYHIYGQQKSNLSVGKVKVLQYVGCENFGLTLNCINSTVFDPIPTAGDGTVPTYSSRRISSQYNLNSLTAKRYIENAKADSNITEDNAEHTKLTENPRVQKRIEKILLNEDDYSGDNATIADNNDPISPTPVNANNKLAPTAEEQSFYVSMHNVSAFHLGITLPLAFTGTSGPNGSQAIPIGEKAVWLGMTVSDNYSIAFYGDGSPIKVQVIKGLDYDRVETLVQYIDVIIPADKVAVLSLTPTGTPFIRYDADNDGIPETPVEQTVSVTGETAKDLEAPVVSFDYQTQAAGKLVTLSATDNLSGVRKIYYSLNGQQFNEYIEPVAVNAGQNLSVFAEDNNRNRTGIGQIDVAGTTYSIGNRIWFDVNNDGKINQNEFPEEVGVNGASVSLFADTNGDGQPDNINQPLKTTTTSNGYYRFSGLNAGSYVVRVNPVNFADNGILQGYLNTTIQTSDDTDSDSTQAGENGILPNGQRSNIQNIGILSGSITLGPNLSEPQNETDVSGSDKGEFDKYSNLTVDFGFYRLGLSGTVWNDSGNRNGYLENGENGLANYRIKLFQSSGEIPVGNDGILGTSDDSNGGILTDTGGIYTFQGLENGDYSVKVTRQFANASLQTSVNPNDNADSDNNGSLDADSPESTQVSSLPVTISSASRGLLENTRINEFAGLTENPTIDFGLFFAPTASNVTVSGRIINQQNRGISRASVTITATDQSSAKTVRTNQLGYFKFTEIPAGNDYIISGSHKNYTFNSTLISVDDAVDGVIISSNN